MKIYDPGEALYALARKAQLVEIPLPWDAMSIAAQTAWYLDEGLFFSRAGREEVTPSRVANRMEKELKQLRRDIADAREPSKADIQQAERLQVRLDKALKRRIISPAEALYAILNPELADQWETADPTRYESGAAWLLENGTHPDKHEVAA